MLKKLFNLHKYNYLFTPLKFKIQPWTYRDELDWRKNKGYYDICLSRWDAILYHKEIFQPITKDKIAEVYKELHEKLKSNK